MLQSCADPTAGKAVGFSRVPSVGETFPVVDAAKIGCCFWLSSDSWNNSSNIPGKNLSSLFDVSSHNLACEGFSVGGTRKP